MENCKTTSIPIIGSLRFLCNNRPDISYGIGLLSRFMDNPQAPHMTAAKHILRYLKGTSDIGLLFPIGNDQNRSCIEAYSNSYWFDDKVERKSTSGYLFNVVALSSCEVEYIGSAEAACQSLWLEALLEEMKL
ncbi:hypothetical protein CR513_18244, partial [Mucuna pruriens]